MADNTRVKKLARKLQAETGMRYTEALARVRLQGAAAPEKNMTPTTVDTLDLGIWLTSIGPLAPGETREFRFESERLGYIRRLRIEAPNLATLVAESFTVSGLPQTTGGPCPASMLLGDVGPLFLDPGQQVRVTLTNHGGELQTVAVHLGFDDRTEAAYDQYSALFEAGRAAGMVKRNQYNGLGVVILKPGETGVLQDTLNRNVQIKHLVLEMAPGDDEVPQDWAETQVTVTGITFAGLPVDMASMPLCAVRESKVLSGTLALVGQTVSVHLTNPTEHLVIVSGGLKTDELNPYWAQQQFENTLIQAAIQGTKEPIANPQVGQAEPWQAAQAGHIEVAVRPVDGHCLERLELTVVGSTAPFELLLNGVDLPCDWSESDGVDGGWGTIVHFKDGRVFGPGPDSVVGTEWRTSGPPVPTTGEALSVVVVQGEGVAAAKVFTAWQRPVA